MKYLLFLAAIGCSETVEEPATEPTCALTLTYCATDGGSCDTCMSEDHEEGWYECTDGWRYDIVGVPVDVAANAVTEHCAARS